MNGRKEGKGVWKKVEYKGPERGKCNLYEGEYLEDMKHGHGQFTWESGNYYKG